VVGGGEGLGAEQLREGLTVIENDLLEVGESALSGWCGCWVAFFDIALSVVNYKLVEIVETCKLGGRHGSRRLSVAQRRLEELG
jgi:hypothetical protein